MSKVLDKTKTNYMELLKNKFLNILSTTCCSNLNNNDTNIGDKDIFISNFKNFKNNLDKETKYYKHFNWDILDFDNSKKGQPRKNWNSVHDEILKDLVFLFGDNLDIIKLFMPNINESVILKKLNSFISTKQHLLKNEKKMITSFRSLELESNKVNKFENLFMEFSIDGFIKTEKTSQSDLAFKNTVSDNLLTSNRDSIFNKNIPIKDFQIEKEIEDIFNIDTEVHDNINMEDIINISFDNEDNLIFNHN